MRCRQNEGRNESEEENDEEAVVVEFVRAR